MPLLLLPNYIIILLHWMSQSYPTNMRLSRQP